MVSAIKSFVLLVILILPMEATASTISGGARLAGAAFVTAPPTCSSNVLLTFDAGVDAAEVTLAAISNSTFGSYFTYTSLRISNLVFDVSGQKNLINTNFICNYGAYSGSGSVGMRAQSTNTGYIQIFNRTNVSRVSAGGWMKSTVPPSLITYIDVAMIPEDLTLGGSQDYCNLTILNGTSTLFKFYLESPRGAQASSAIFNTNTWYWITMLYDVNATNLIWIYDTNQTLLAQLTSGSIVAPATNSNRMFIGRHSQSVSADDPSYNVYYDNWKFDFNGGQFPLLP